MSDNASPLSKPLTPGHPPISLAESNLLSVDPFSAVENLSGPPGADEDVPCPMCRYNLRGLVDEYPRCPECGYAFKWAELRDPTRRLHPYLFEHHPDNNVGSFIRTLIGQWLPTRFWRTLLPMQPSRPRRLFAYWLVVLFGLGVCWVLCYGGLLIISARDNARTREWLKTFYAAPRNAVALKQLQNNSGKTLERYLNDSHPPFPSRALFRQAHIYAGARSIELFAALWVLWPITTIGVMALLRISMRRAKLRPIHVARCVVYSGDIVLWLALASIGGTAWTIAHWRFGTARNYQDIGTAAALGWACPIAALLFLWRLIAAYRKYLRFPHSVATVLLTQVLVLLLLLFELQLMTRRN